MIKTQIKLFDNSLNYLLLTKSEVDNLKIDLNKLELKYSTNKIDVLHYRNYNSKKFGIDDLLLDNNFINLISIQSLSDGTDSVLDIVNRFKNTDIPIYFIGDICSEREIFSPNNNEKDNQIIDLISNTKNIKVLHHLINLNTKNFIFCRKLLFYGMINYIPTTVIYDYFYKYWNSIKKEYRIGYHLNRLYDGTRVRILNTIINSKIIENDKIFVSINQSQNNSEYYNKSYKKFIIKNNLIHSHDDIGVNGIWYICNFFNLSIKSDIELVYETNPTSPLNFKHKNLTEKSIKPIMLGKPTIYIDSTSHNFIKRLGFKTYDLLLSDNLLKIYNAKENIPNKNELDNLIPDFLNESIDKLLKMKKADYDKVLDACKSIAEYNKNLFYRIMYKETITNLLK
jgi:hypothetical protein